MRSLEVLAEPTRRRILDLLCTRDRSVNEISRDLSIGQPRASKHIRVLRDAGLGSVRRDAQHRAYSPRPRPLLGTDA